MPPRKLQVVGDAEDAFLAALSHMPPEYLDCRAMQHSWTLTDRLRVVDSRTEAGVRPVKGEITYARRTVTCDRCSMKRHDAFQMTARHGHTALRKIGAHYDTTNCPDYSMKGTGNTAGMRDLLLGSLLEAEINAITVKRGRPKRNA